MPYYCNIDTCQVPRFDREREWLAHQWRVHKVAGLFICGKLCGVELIYSTLTNIDIIILPKKEYRYMAP